MESSFQLMICFITLDLLLFTLNNLEGSISFSFADVSCLVTDAIIKFSQSNLL